MTKWNWALLSIIMILVFSFSLGMSLASKQEKSNSYYYELELIIAGKNIKTYETMDFNYHPRDKSIRFKDANTDEYVFLYLHEADLIIKRKIKGEDFDK